MAYCIQSDLEEQISEADLIQLTDDDNAGVVDAGVVTRAIDDADAEINGHCGKQYSVPFSTVPPIIRKLSVDIAIYNLCARRGGAPEDRKERYDNAIKFLTGVATGKNALGEDDPDESSSSHKPEISSNDRIFSRDKMEGF